MAVEAVKAGLMTANKAAIAFGVPQRTVYNRMDKLKRMATFMKPSY
jgi:hypothetical protein